VESGHGGGETAPTKILHIMTAPQSLYQFLRGQVEYVQERGFEIHAAASPGEWMEKIVVRDHVSVHAVEIPRGLNPIRDLIAILYLYRVIRNVRPEIVQSGTPRRPAWNHRRLVRSRSGPHLSHSRSPPDDSDWPESSTSALDGEIVLPLGPSRSVRQPLNSR
jgi:hypothetical protein